MRTFRNTTIKLNHDLAEREGVASVARVGRIGAWFCNLQKMEAWWSPELYELFELPLNLEYLPLSTDFFLDGTGILMKEGLERIVGEGKGFDIEVVFLDGKGERCQARATGEPFHSAEGPCVFGCFHDMTPYYHARQEAVAAQQFSDRVLDNIPHMIFVKDAKELRYIRFNRASGSLLSIDPNFMLGKNDYDFFPKDQADSFTAKDRSALESGQTIDIPEEYIDTPGGRRCLHTKKISVQGDDGKPAYLLGISDDITERKAQQEMIEQQRIALVSAARLSALGEMAGGIAHEINNPLAIIRGIGEQMSSIVEESTPDLDRLGTLSGRLIATVDRIASIVSGLKDFSRDGEGDPFQTMTLKELVLKTLSLCSEKFRTHGVQVDVSGLDASVQARCQPVRFSQVLVNLFNNSYDALVSQDPARRKALIVTSTHLNDGRVQLEVRDTGPGIPDALIPKIMIPFFTTKPVGHGTGLGLSIASGICEAHGGLLTYRRGPEGGACFTITLPSPAQAKGV